MELASIGRRLLNAHLWGLILVAAVAFVVSRLSGLYLQRYHPLLRYAPGLLFIAGGGIFGLKKEGQVGYGWGVSIGGGLDIAMTAAERSGLLARVGVK